MTIKKLITKLEFVAFFSNSEYTNLLNTIKTDVELELWYEKFKLLDKIYVRDQFIFSGVKMMVDKNIIPREKLIEIMQSPDNP